MTAKLEQELGIISVADAISFFHEHYPNDEITELQIEYKGPFIKYEFYGNDGNEQHEFDFNAMTKDILTDKSKIVKPKRQAKLAQKAVDTNNLLPLSEVTDIALDHVPADVDVPFEWELERKKNRTVWEIEIANSDASKIYEVKVDAQNGTVIEIELEL